MDVEPTQRGCCPPDRALRWAGGQRRALGRTAARSREAKAMDLSAVKRPSAWVPLAMSGTALALVLGHLLRAGAAPQADEGLAAHLWQLLMAGQLPVVALFAARWLPRAPGPALR